MRLACMTFQVTTDPLIRPISGCPFRPLKDFIRIAMRRDQLARGTNCPSRSLL